MATSRGRPSYAVEHHLHIARPSTPPPRPRTPRTYQEVFEALLRGKRFREPTLGPAAAGHRQQVQTSTGPKRQPPDRGHSRPGGGGALVLDGARPACPTAVPYLHFEGYTAAEIGRILGAKRNTVLSWLARGRQALRERMIGGFDDA
ncbi:MAG: RNA polymerase sigma factor [Flavonifractor plautii]